VQTWTTRVLAHKHLGPGPRARLGISRSALRRYLPLISRGPTKETSNAPGGPPETWPGWYLLTDEPGDDGFSTRLRGASRGIGVKLFLVLAREWYNAL